jgi:hypothetical protein
MDKMSLREKYHFDDFTEEAYRACLKLASSSYRFIDFHEPRDGIRVCLWRHDIDTSPQRGLSLARIENEEGVKSTYFFLLHCDRYNLLDYQVREVMLEIRALGHEIGLHFDPVYYGSQIADIDILDKKLTYERDILSEVIHSPVRVFSFHNPSVNNLIKIDNEYLGDMVNAFSSSIQNNFSYCSDSFCYWRYRRLVEVLKDDSISRLHILTHPVCWTPEVQSPYSRFLRAVNGRASSTINRYLANAKNHNRKIIR